MVVLALADAVLASMNVWLHSDKIVCNYVAAHADVFHVKGDMWNSIGS